jgi:hypothetical protein
MPFTKPLRYFLFNSASRFFIPRKNSTRHIHRQSQVLSKSSGKEIPTAKVMDPDPESTAHKMSPKEMIAFLGMVAETLRLKNELMRQGWSEGEAYNEASEEICAKRGEEMEEIFGKGASKPY